MAKRLIVAVLVASLLAVAAAYASAFLPGGAPAWAPWAMAIGLSASMVAVMALGAARAGRGIGRLGLPLAFTFVVLAGGFGWALLLPGGTGSGLVLGLPPGAAIMLYGVGLLPLFVLPVAYVLTFDDFTLTEEDLRRVRDAAERVRREAAHAEAAREGAHT